jgi:hypothetical protein
MHVRWGTSILFCVGLANTAAAAARVLGAWRKYVDSSLGQSLTASEEASGEAERRQAVRLSFALKPASSCFVP